MDKYNLVSLAGLVVLMGVEHLPHVAAMPTKHGRAPDTRVATIERGTQPSDCTVTGTLSDITERARLAGIRPPATIVIGEVVRVGKTLHRELSACPARVR